MTAFKWTGERLQLFDYIVAAERTYTELVRVFHWKFTMHALKQMAASGYVKKRGDRFVATCEGILARTVAQL